MLGETIRETAAPTVGRSWESIEARQRSVIPGASAWLDDMPGLRVEAAEWGRSLGAVREAIPARVDALLAPHCAWRRAARNLHVVRTFGRAGFGAAAIDGPRALVGRQEFGALGARRLRKAFERLGPSYIKLGQFISSG